MKLDFKGFFAVLNKELKDSLRDRRGLIVALAPAILAPWLITYMLSSMADKVADAENLLLAVVGQQYAPDLIRYLQDAGIDTKDFKGDKKVAIQNKEEPVILAITDDFAERFAQAKQVSVELFADASLDKSSLAISRVNSAINAYSQSIGALRLMVRGVNPVIANPVRVQRRDFSTDQGRAGKMLALLQMFVLMAAFFGCAGVAIDTTAGERERNSLEPLLIHPLSSLQIMAGKWLAVAFYGMLATLLVVLSTAIALEFNSMQALGVDPKLTAMMQVSIFFLLLPMVLLASSAQMLVSLFAKTFKEAQSYIGLLTMIPMLPVMITLFMDFKTAYWMYFVPVLSQQQLLTTVLRGEAWQASQLLLSISTTLVLSVVLFMLLTRLLRSERVVYGS